MPDETGSVHRCPGSGPAYRDRPADPLEVPVDLTSVSAEVDVPDQLHEVGFDDGHDHDG
jgi:hypothetical protein